MATFSGSYIRLEVPSSVRFSFHEYHRGYLNSRNRCFHVALLLRSLLCPLLKPGYPVIMTQQHVRMMII